MTNAMKLLRSSFSFAGTTFIVVSFTRIAYTYDAVDAETEGLEIYIAHEGIEMFVCYADPSSPLGERAAEALAGVHGTYRAVAA